MVEHARPPKIQNPYLLSSRLASLDGPPDPDRIVYDADSLLDALVDHAESGGRYYASARLMRRLFWWQDTPDEDVEAWRDELVGRGDIAIFDGARSCYTDKSFQVVIILDRHRFDRWKNPSRQPIPDSVRLAIYIRDEFRCVTCGRENALTLDHIYPYSLGGGDEPGNLQTMCRPCNSRKGARVA